MWPVMVLPMQRHTIAFIAAAVLVVIGIVLMVWTEPAGDDGSGASGGVADVSEDEQPYFWPGLIVLVIGVLVAVFGGLEAKKARERAPF